jgi:hypothetical protein
LPEAGKLRDTKILIVLGNRRQLGQARHAFCGYNPELG